MDFAGIEFRFRLSRKTVKLENSSSESSQVMGVPSVHMLLVRRASVHHSTV